MKQHVSTHAQKQLADYVERLVHELSRITFGANLPLLSYLLAMAAEEAALIRNGQPVVARPSPADGSRVPRGRPDRA